MADESRPVLVITVRGSLVTERQLAGMTRRAMAAADVCVCGHSRHRHRPEGPCRHATCRCPMYQPVRGK